MNEAQRTSRVWALVRAARILADGQGDAGQETRSMLQCTCGLSIQGIELALRRHLEVNPSDLDIQTLVASAGDAPRVQVVLSANVFVGALRAMALAVAAAPEVVVRPSSREPSFCQALVDAMEDACVASSIAITDVLETSIDDEVHLYGRDETMRVICHELPRDQRVRAHGTGLGVVAVGSDANWFATARAVAMDVVPFDQRGCLSPRVVLLHGSLADAKLFAKALTHELLEWESKVPIGSIEPGERAALVRYKDTMSAVGDVLEASTSVIGYVEGARTLLLPPPGRHVHIAACRDAREAKALIGPWERFVVALGEAECSDPFVSTLEGFLPKARIGPVGQMQCPALDGPVDRRQVAVEPAWRVLERLGDNS